MSRLSMDMYGVNRSYMFCMGIFSHKKEALDMLNKSYLRLKKVVQKSSKNHWFSNTLFQYTSSIHLFILFESITLIILLFTFVLKFLMLSRFIISAHLSREIPLLLRVKSFSSSGVKLQNVLKYCSSGSVKS